jgi:hypothetical protein
MKINILMPIMTFMTRFYHNFSFNFRSKSGDNNFHQVLRPALFVLAVLFLLSCEEDATKIGSELLPSNDYVTIGSTDTLSVYSYTFYDNSLPTSNPQIGFVGSIFDPYFGTTTTEFVSQVRLGGGWDFGPVTIDSVKLILKLLSVKGENSGAGHMLRISEISDILSEDSTYYSNTPTHTTGFEVAAQLPELTLDTINDITVSLPVEFGEYLIRDTTKLFYSNTKDDFRTWFKGVHFQLDASTDPLIVAFSLVSDVATTGTYNNYFVLYMHDTSFVSQRYYFILDAVHPNVCYDKFARDFSTADPDKKIEHINDISYRDTLTYLQYLNGVYTKVVFPGLDSLRQVLTKGRFSINKARLSVPAFYDGDRFTALTVPSSLRLRYNYKDSVKLDVPDYYMDTNHQFFDGDLHATDSTYYFNIASYIQTYLEDKKGYYPPELEIYQAATGLSSAILRANANKTPVKFELTFTKF